MSTELGLCGVRDYAELARRPAWTRTISCSGTPHSQGASKGFQEVEESVGGREAEWLRCGILDAPAECSLGHALRDGTLVDACFAPGPAGPSVIDQGVGDSPWLSLLGAAGERIGYDRWLKANTVKRRTHSLFRQGLMLRRSEACSWNSGCIGRFSA